jgi:hypothetical protein
MKSRGKEIRYSLTIERGIRYFCGTNQTRNSQMGCKLVLCGWRIPCSLQSKAWHSNIRIRLVNKTATRACRNMIYWYIKLKRPLPLIHIEVGNLRPNHILDRGHNISFYRKWHPPVVVSNTHEKITITIPVIECYLQ